MLVTDWHHDGLNILIEELDPRAHLNAGLKAPFAMIEGIQGDVEAALFIGYHARAGTLQGVLDHTWSSGRVAGLWLNGRPAGETALNGAVCGHYQVPVLMVSGDQALAEEASGWIRGVETAVVKRSTGRLSAECLPLAEAHERIRAAAERAVKNHIQGKSPLPLEIKTPITLTIEYLSSSMADSAAIFPGVRRLDGKRLEVVQPNMPAAYFAFQSLVNLA